MNDTRSLRIGLVVAAAAIAIAVVWMLASVGGAASPRAPGPARPRGGSADQAPATLATARSAAPVPDREEEPVRAPSPPEPSIARRLRATHDSPWRGSFFLRAVDAVTEQPIAGASVRLTSVSQPSRIAIVLETDEEGWLEIAEASGLGGEMEVRCRGYAPALLTSSVRNHPTTEEALVVRLRAAASLEGVVYQADGTAIVGQTVAVSAEALDLRPARFLGRGIEGSRRVGWAVTDELGRFTLDDLPSRVPLLLIAEDERARSRLEPMRLLLDPDERRSVQWWQRTPVGVAGRVFEPGGTPSPDAVVRLERADGTGGGPPALAVEDDGTFEFEPVQPGEWRIAATLRQRELAAETTLTLCEGDDPHFVELSLAAKPGGATLRGRVVTASGDPEPRAVVGFFGDARQRGEASCDGEGRFAMDLPSDAAGRLRASVDLDVLLGDLSVQIFEVAAFASLALERIPDEEVVLVLEPAGSLPVRVVDREGRSVVTVASILARERAHGDLRAPIGVLAVATLERSQRRAVLERMSGREEENGVQSVGPIRAGTYDVVVQCSDGMVGVTESVLVDLSALKPVSITVDAGGWLEVFVRSDERALARETMPCTLRIQRGAATIACLPAGSGICETLVVPGLCRLELLDGSEVLAAAEVDVRAGAVHRVELRPAR